MIQYLAPSLVYLAAIIALVGPVRGASGAITTVGWGTALVASLGFCVSIATLHGERRRWATIRKHAHDMVTPHLLALFDIVDFVFVLHRRGDEPGEQGLRPPGTSAPERLTLSRTSDEWIEALETFNFLPPRRSPIEQTMQAKDPRRLPSTDVLEQIAGVPFADDSRPFHRIVSERAATAVAEIRRALLDASLQSFDGDVLRAIQSILDDEFVFWMTDLARALDKFLKVDGSYAENNGKVSLVYDGETQYAMLGPGRKTYVDFIEALGELLDKLGATRERQETARRLGSFH